MAEGERHPIVRRLQSRRERHLDRSRAYRIGFAVAGFLVTAGGLALLVLPGPGLLLIAIGLAMLALEFVWAERMLELALARLDDVRPRTRRETILVAVVTVALAAGALTAILLWDIPLLPF